MTARMLLTLGPDRQERSFTCDCCKAPIDRSWCFVYADDVPYALYYANCNHHVDQDHDAWIDVIFGTWGQGAPYYNDYRWQHQINESMNFGRTFQLREKMYLNIRAEFFNVFNRLNLPTPSATNPTATATFNNSGVPTGGFGYITNSSGIGGQRNGQFIARFQF